MKRFLWLLIALTAIASMPSRANAQQFWMAGIPISWMNKQSHLPPNDLMDIFAPDAAWQGGLAKISVFKVPAQLVLFASDEQLRTVFKTMQRRHVRMALEMGAVVLLDPSCGGGEGYAPTTLADRLGRRLQALGLTLDYGRLMERQTGRGLAFFHADIAAESRAPWLPQVAAVKAAMHRMGIPFGAVVGGGPKDKSEAAWTQSGLDFLATLNRSPATALDQIVIQSWQPFPTRMLPQSQPGTETFLLLRSEQLVAPDAHAVTTGQ